MCCFYKRVSGDTPILGAKVVKKRQESMTKTGCFLPDQPEWLPGAAGNDGYTIMTAAIAAAMFCRRWFTFSFSDVPRQRLRRRKTVALKGPEWNCCR